MNLRYQDSQCSSLHLLQIYLGPRIEVICMCIGVIPELAGHTLISRIEVEKCVFSGDLSAGVLNLLMSSLLLLYHLQVSPANALALICYRYMMYMHTLLLYIPMEDVCGCVQKSSPSNGPFSRKLF